VNIGCVRLTERHLHGDPPLPVEIAATVEDIDAALSEAAAAVPAGKARTLVGLAGSVTTVAAIALGLEAYDSARIHHSRITAVRVHEITGDLLAMTRAQRAAIPVMHPGRVDVIGAGALILDRIMTRFGFAEVLVSEHDILDGIAWSLSYPPGGDPPYPPDQSCGVTPAPAVVSRGKANERAKYRTSGPWRPGGAGDGVAGRPGESRDAGRRQRRRCCRARRERS
jgi:hypothetical protein